MNMFNIDALDSVSRWSIGLCSNRVEVGLHAASWLLSVEFHCLISACWVLNFDCLTDVKLVKLIAKVTFPSSTSRLYTVPKKQALYSISLLTSLLFWSLNWTSALLATLKNWHDWFGFKFGNSPS